MVVPEHLRAVLRGRSLAHQLDTVEQLRAAPGATSEHRVTVVTLRSIAARVRFLTDQVAELDRELAALLNQHPAGPALLAEPGVGPVVAAQLLVSWSHSGRVRSEAAFASLAGAAPLEASSGQRTRHRLNRGGDRNLNRALHTVAVTRLRCHKESAPTSQAHARGQDAPRGAALPQARTRSPALPDHRRRHPATNGTSSPTRRRQGLIAGSGAERRAAPACLGRPGRPGPARSPDVVRSEEQAVAGANDGQGLALPAALPEAPQGPAGQRPASAGPAGTRSVLDARGAGP